MAQRYAEGSPEAALLAEINQGIDETIDWKKGALDYARNLSPEDVQFLYRKPFRYFGDMGDFYRESYRFLNFMERINPPAGSRFLDVACGPGWTCEYLARMGHRVVGIDIAGDLLRVARKRLDAFPFPPFGAGLDVRLAEHDIENGPFLDTEPFDIAVIESALHHFVDPIAALRNVRAALKEDGILCIMETVSPPRDSEHWKHDVEIMERFHTLERPFSREQFKRLLEIAGFPYYRFHTPINGWFDERNPQDHATVAESWRESQNLNFCLASPNRDFIDKRCPATVFFLSGVYESETGPGGELFRWSQPNCQVHVPQGGPPVLRVRAPLVSVAPESVQHVYVLHKGAIVAHLKFRSPDEIRQWVVPENLRDGTPLTFQSNVSWSPRWNGQDDPRLLSFQFVDPEQ